MYLKNKSVVVVRLMVIALSLLLLLSACASKTATESATNPPAEEKADATAAPVEEELKPVELTWYYPQGEIQADLQTVEDAVNKVTQSKINATIKLKPATFGEYAQKLNVVVASGEKADIIWTSSWLFNYVENQSKGAFIPLDDLIDKYAPDLKNSMPAYVFDGPRIEGKVYAIPNYQTMTSIEGFVMQQRFIDKYALDTTTIKTPSDITPYLEKIKAGETDMIPLLMDRRGAYDVMQNSLGLEAIGTALTIDVNHPDKVLNRFETPQYKKYLDLVRGWYQKGLINQDAATLKDYGDYIKIGKAATYYHNSLKPGGETEEKAANGGFDVKYLKLTEPVSATFNTLGTMNAISRTSENPERAMMFINLLNTDKEIYNLITYGIEGKHYAKNGDGTIKVNADAGYAPNTDWVFGNVFNGYLLEGKSVDVLNETKTLNDGAKASPIMGFKFQVTPVSAEIANINTVIDEYKPGLDTGTIDASAKLAEFQDKLKKAGIDKLVEEAQKQLDAWYKTK